MNVLVLGGSGRVGRRVVRLLREMGHAAEPGSRSTGLDVLTGRGLKKSVAGKDVVVDVINQPLAQKQDRASFFTTATRNILAAEVAADVQHHLVVSIVGCERLTQEGSSLRAKFAQEEAVRAGSVPFTILRATQFFEFLPTIADASTTGGTVTLPMTTFQPVAADDVAQAVVDAALARPKNTVVELAGPDRGQMVDMIRRVLDAREDRRRVITHPTATYMGMEVDATSLVPLGEAVTGTTGLTQWLSSGRNAHDTQEGTSS